MEFAISSRDFRKIAKSFDSESIIRLEVKGKKLTVYAEGEVLKFDAIVIKGGYCSVLANDLMLTPRTHSKKLWLTLVLGTFDKYIYVSNAKGYLHEINIIKGEPHATNVKRQLRL